MRQLVAVAALALALLTPSLAGGAYDPVGSGGTTVRLGNEFARLLDSNGVELVARAPAKLRGGKAVFFPVAGGKLDPPSGAGTVEHEGSLVLRSAKGSIALRALKLKTTQRRAPLSAKLGGSQLKLFSAARLQATRAGFGVRIETQGLRLSAKVATRLGKKLGLRGVFAPGQAVGRSLTVADPTTVALRGAGSVAFAPDPGFMAKLDARFVAANPIFPAERTGAAFALPIAGGSLAPDASSGVIHSAGSLELLQLSGGQVFWRELWLDFSTATLSAELEVEPSPPYAGKVGPTPIATLGPVPMSSDPQKLTISASAVALALSPQAAGALNQAFAQGAPVFAPGEPLGSISFSAGAR
jgi:hypothetical protein